MIGSILLRFIVGAAVWLWLLTLAIGSVMPYGGGSPIFVLLFLASTVLIPIWILMPLRQLDKAAAMKVAMQKDCDDKVLAAIKLYKSGTDVELCCPSCQSRLIVASAKKGAITSSSERVETSCECTMCNGKYDVQKSFPFGSSESKTID